MTGTIWNEHFVRSLRIGYALLAVIPVLVIMYNRYAIIDRAKQFKAPKAKQRNAIQSSITFLVILILLFVMTLFMNTTTENNDQQTDRQQVSR